PISRRADKTGLIAWKANKYSVPMAWQQARVGVLESDSQLHISDLDTGDVIASHALCSDKGKVIKNTHHYRDHAQRVSKLEAGIDALIGNEIGHQLCQLHIPAPHVHPFRTNVNTSSGLT